VKAATKAKAKAKAKGEKQIPFGNDKQNKGSG
jgi:hypothetical protein